MAINWNTLENLIHGQIVAASGLPATSVIWEHQNRDRPVAPFISLRLEDSNTIAQHTAEQTIRDNPAPVAGQEILLGIVKTIEFTLFVSVVTVPTAGSLSAFARLQAIRSMLETETIQDPFFAAGVSLWECGQIQNVPRILETQFEGRATLPLKFRCADQVEIATTYIESAEWVSVITTQ